MRSPKPRPSLAAAAAEMQVFDGNGSIMMFDFDGDCSSNSSYAAAETAAATANKLPKTLPMMADLGAEEDELSWRLDPSRSMSDWTITVNNLNTRLSKNYFVHKNMLAVGKRKSPYFVDVFKTKLREASADRMTELFFPALAAEAMPVLLDYIYVGETVLELSSTTAPGLRYLAQFFGIRILFEEIMKFIQADLSLNTLTSYYKAGVGLEDRKVLNVVSKHIVRNIALIEETHDIVETMEPPFFTKVLASSDLSSPANMVHTSILLAKYCGLWKQKLDPQAFLELTNENILGHIYHGAALPLLEIESDLGLSGDGAKELTSLQARCIASLAPKWDSLCDVDPGRTREICNKLPTRVVTEMMMKSLSYAKRQKEKEVRTIRASEAEKRNYITTRMKSDYDKLVDELRSICGDKDRMIKMYAMELSRFRRVPNSTNSKLVPSGRSNKQTVAPEIAKHEMEGYLLVNKKQVAKYPVFYYQ